MKASCRFLRQSRDESSDGDKNLRRIKKLQRRNKPPPEQTPNKLQKQSSEIFMRYGTKHGDKGSDAGHDKKPVKDSIDRLCQHSPLDAVQFERLGSQFIRAIAAQYRSRRRYRRGRPRPAPVSSAVTAAYTETPAPAADRAGRSTANASTPLTPTPAPHSPAARSRRSA